MVCRFTAMVYRVGMNYCVDIPARATRTWRASKTVPVELEVSGANAHTTALKRADGAYRVFLTTSLRLAGGVAEGDPVSISLRRTSELSEPEIPNDLEQALERAAANRDAWDAITLRQRRDFVRYLSEARQGSTRSNRLAEGLKRIREKASKRRTRESS